MTGDPRGTRSAGHGDLGSRGETAEFERRRATLRALQAAGITGYGGRFARTGSLQAVLAAFAEEQVVTVAGRVMARRAHGRALFADLRDETAKLQLHVREDVVGGAAFALFDKVDLGDIMGVRGRTFLTQRGEKTVEVQTFTFLAKGLRPIPEKWHGLKDRETRYRQRYLDLMVNEEVRTVFRQRSRIITEIRRFLDARGYLEVETPMMHPLPGGAMGRPFRTHHQALGLDLFLRMAPELYLKRLLVGGCDRVYELNRNFRNEGLSPRHNPEFTMLEVYEAYGDASSMMVLTEELVLSLAEVVHGQAELPSHERPIALARPWPRVSFAELAARECGIAPTDGVADMARKLAARGVIRREDLGEGEALAAIPRNTLAKLVMGWLDRLLPERGGAPVFVTDLFEVFSPLAKGLPDRPGVVDRFELFVGGVELANGYSELTDPIEQRRRLEDQQQHGPGDEARGLDEEFLRALEYGMPPAGGLGIGVDRLVMVLTDQDAIRDVMLFPQLRPPGRTGS